MTASISPLARRACAILLVLVAAIALGVTPASAQCGQTTNVGPRRSLGPGAAPLAVGDSVLYDASQTLSYYGFQSNAMVCRTMAQGIIWLETHAQNLPVLVVVALGTNGAVTMGQIDQLLGIVGPSRLLAMVTPHGGNYAYVPGLIRSAAQQHPGQIVVLDWDRLSAGHPDWFAPDGIHLGSAAGVDAYARLIASALLSGPASIPAPTVVRPTRPTRPTRPPRVVRPKPVPAGPARPAQPAWVSTADRLVQLVESAVGALLRWVAGW